MKHTKKYWLMAVVFLFACPLWAQINNGGGGGGGLPAGCSSPSTGVIQCNNFTTTGGSTAGNIGLTQGTAPSTTAGAVQIVAPGSVTAYNLVLPGSTNTGFLSCITAGSTSTCSFAASAVSNFYTSTTGTGIGPTSFTPASTCTVCILDATASTGSTKVFLGYDNGGSFTGAHISATKTNLSIVSGSTQSTNDAVSFIDAGGTLRGSIITLGGNNAFTVQSAGLLALGAAGGQAAFIQASDAMTDQTGFGVTQTSTASLTGLGPVPVKADTTNANQVVETVTTDTGPGVVIGVCINSPAVSGTCHIIQLGIAAMKLGTGTCSIGNFVIVDTTTNGDVKCTGTYTAGTVIGVAMAADSTVGTSFNVMVGLR